MSRTHRSGVAGLVLAAGGSTRLGGAKQLLPYRGSTLLKHAVTCALKSSCDRIFVVLGAHRKLCANEIHELPIDIIDCPNWSEGLSASLRAGISAIAAFKNIDGALIMLCDQPLISSGVLDRIVRAFRESKAKIVASEYSGIPGAPALIRRSLFPKIDTLRGDSGAGGIIRRHRSDTITIPFPGGSLDIDTFRDYEEIVSGNVLGSNHQK